MPRKTWTLDVTAELIATAIPRNSGHCMIADALRAAIPSARFISVDLQTIRWSDPETNRRYICFTPGIAQQNLVAFDQEIMPEPHTFRIVPVQILKIGSSRKRGKERERRSMNTGRDSRRGGVSNSPVIEGGAAPPLAALSNRTGRRREFGLRQARR